MKTFPPTLAPLLRSNSQGLMLAALFLDASREHSLSQLAGLSGTAVPTTMREVDRLVEAGFVLDRRIGATRLVRANAEHPMFSAVRELVLYAYGPVAVLTPILSEVNGVERAFIFGSWAARVRGEAGHDPGDIDVLIVGEVSSRKRSEIGEHASAAMRREVNVHNLSEADWESAESGFVKTVKSRPMIELNFEHSSKRTSGK